MKCGKSERVYGTLKLEYFKTVGAGTDSEKTGRRRIRMNHEVQMQSLRMSNDEYLFTDMLSHQLFEIFSINFHFSVTLNLKKS